MDFFTLRIEESVTIAKPIDDVFRLIARWDLLLPEIDDKVKWCKRETRAAVGVGTYRELMQTGPMKTEILATFTAFNRPHSYEYTAVASTLDGGGHMRCEAVDAGTTTFHVRLDGKPRGIGWLVMPMMKSDIAKREKIRLANMKRMMESGELAAPANALDAQS